MSLAHPTLEMGVSGERDDFGIFKGEPVGRL